MTTLTHVHQKHKMKWEKDELHNQTNQEEYRNDESNVTQISHAFSQKRSLQPDNCEQNSYLIGIAADG